MTLKFEPAIYITPTCLLRSDHLSRLSLQYNGHAVIGRHCKTKTILNQLLPVGPSSRARVIDGDCVEALNQATSRVLDYVPCEAFYQQVRHTVEGVFSRDQRDLPPGHFLGPPMKGWNVKSSVRVLTLVRCHLSGRKRIASSP